jgi:hypothetical protein
MLISEMSSLLAKRQKVLIFRRKIPRTKKLFSEIEKKPDTKEVSI